MMSQSAWGGRRSIATGTALLALLVGSGVSQAATVVALDNTAGGTATLSGLLGSIEVARWNVRVFTVGSSNATISSMKMGMYSSSLATYNITWALYAVDGSNNPTGAVLATDTQSQQFTSTGGGSSAYYVFTTGGTLASYSMQAGQTYALAFKSDATDTSLSWTTPSGNPSYAPGSSGFTYVQSLRTSDNGNTYSVNTFNNAWQMNVSVAAVPGSGALGIAGLGLAGVARRRRR